MTRLIIWRHGQTQWNSSGRVQGQTDVDLDGTGLAQAAAAAPLLAAREPSVIIASDLLRAARTAQALAELTGLPVEFDPRLRERHYGPWEGLVGPEIRALDPAAYERWGTRAEGDVPGVEPLAQLRERVGAALTDAAKRVGDGAAVVVTHGGAARAGCAALLDWPVPAAQSMKILHNCHVTELSYTDNRGWQLHAHNVR